ncbi:ScbR family autoregulator-binding transcription factor [Streptomyces sp. NPDC051561]|uniref:ScbR family autoregulator-binding transcription factor n=1 Tax=Streptomyces sp. NPDC051561 TaxID=3365658 RepID=UPI0037B0BF52
MQSRSERSRRALLRAGAQIINRDGYAQANLGRIAGAAGMSKGALYFHFASKQGLAEAVQEHGRAVLREFAEALGSGGGSPVQALIDLTHWLARTLHEDEVVRAGFRLTHERGGRRPSDTDFHQACTHEALRLLGRARAAGELRTGTPPGGLGPENLVTVTLCGIAALATTGLWHTELTRRVTELWTPLLATLVPPGDEVRYRTAPPRPALTMPHQPLPAGECSPL